jgi:hypothetical protein
MALNKTTSKLFNPFPVESSTLIVGNSGCGKSTYLKTIFEHTDLYFPVPISNIVIINYNKNVSFDLPASSEAEAEAEAEAETVEEDDEDMVEEEEEDEEGRPRQRLRPRHRRPPPIKSYAPGEFNFDHLTPSTVILFDDVQSLDTVLMDTVNMLCHHKHLAHTFICCQGLLSTTQFKLISYVHNIIFFTGSKSVTKLFRYLISTIFLSAEVKQYLMSILSYCDERDLVVHLLLNKAYNAPYHQVLCHVLKYYSHGYCVAFPFQGRLSSYQDVAEKSVQKMSLTPDRSLTPPPSDLPPNAFVILDAHRVQSVFEASDHEDDDNDDDDDEDEDSRDRRCNTSSEEWTQLVHELHEWVENALKLSQRLPAKRILDALLATPTLCIDATLKRVKVEDQPNQDAVSILDFIMLASRRKGPSEHYNPLYAKCKPIADEMIRKGLASNMYFLNEYILAPPSSGGSRRGAKRQKPPKLNVAPSVLYGAPPGPYPYPYWPPHPPHPYS